MRWRLSTLFIHPTFYYLLTPDYLGCGIYPALADIMRDLTRVDRCIAPSLKKSENYGERIDMYPV